MEKKIIISIHFNSLKYSDKRLTKEWIEERLDIFWQYTLQSFKVQTNQDFEAYLHCDALAMDVVEEALSHREALPANVHFGEIRANEEAIKESIQYSDVFYWVRLDSDNLYHQDYIQKLHDFQPAEGTEALISQKGYIYGESTKRLAHFEHISPPFYTLIYRPKEYIRGKRYELPGGHGSVAKVLRYEPVLGDNFLVTVHNRNVSNGEWLINNKYLLPEQDKETILKEFGM
ncbi:MAG: glycosyltransferase family A protein [Cellulosilyticaceae bacterium]